MAIESAAAAGLKPWREIVTPHKDVASGRYQQAEFAADLWQVHLGEGTDEYRDPVVQLQTNFGGGKTHSMLALYHLLSGTALGELAGIDTVLQEAQATELGAARRVVLVGNKISPGNPVTANRRCRGWRATRARSARSPAKRRRAHRVVVAAGECRGRLRDRAAAALRAVLGPRAVQGPGCGCAVIRGALPDPAPGVSTRVPGCRLREADQGRLSDSSRDLRPPVHGLVDPGEVSAHARGAAADGGGDSQPVGEGRPRGVVAAAQGVERPLQREMVLCLR